MFKKGRKKGTIRFSTRIAKESKKAFLAGDFTNWTPLRMRKQKDGSFAITVPLEAGVHEYKFVVDEQWITDGDNENYALNPHGTLNSVATVQ